MPMTNLYANVEVSEQGDEGLESVYGSDVEQSAWYTADPIAIAASDLEKVNKMLPVWDSIVAIVECGPKEWEEKVKKWLKYLKAQSSFVRKIPNEIYGRSTELSEIVVVGKKYVKSMSVCRGLQPMVDTSIMIVDLLAFCDLDLFGAEDYGGVTKCVQKIMRKSKVWDIHWKLVYVSH